MKSTYRYVHSQQQAADDTLKHACEKLQKICTLLRRKLLRVSATHHQHTRQAPNTEIKLQAGFGLDCLVNGAKHRVPSTFEKAGPNRDYAAPTRLEAASWQGSLVGT